MPESSPESSSRQRILAHLKRTGEASVADLSDGLGLTPVTIRHHLEALLQEGLVARPTARRKPGPGRPELIYRANPAADRLMPRNYGELCGCLLQAAGSERTGQDLTIALEQLGSDLGRADRPSGGAAGIQRYLEQRGYFPSVQRSRGTITVRLANCPYLEVAEAHPSLCHFDRALLGALFDAEVEMQERIIDQHPACSFKISL